MELFKSMQRLLALIALVAMTLSSFVFTPTAALAAPTTVTPSNLDGWAPANIRDTATVAITTTQPRSGNGSLEFFSPNGIGKADYQWNFETVQLRNLILTSLCTIAPASDGQALWRVRNTNDVSVTYTWQIGSGGTPSERTVPANSDDIFQAPVGTMIVKSPGLNNQTKATNPALCTGSIEVTKTVDWNGFPADSNAQFELCVSGANLSDPICQTTSGGTLNFGNLLPGEYTITETDPGSQWTVAISDSPATVVLRETTDVAVTNTHAAYNRINLVSICSDNPAETRRWRVDNANPYDVTFSYDVVGTNQTGTLVVPANSNGANPFFFETTAVGGPNTTRIFVNGVLQSTKASGGQTCAPPVGTLVVTKTVDWDGFEPKAADFEICISGPSYPNGDCKTVAVTGDEALDNYAVNFDLTWTNLIPGEYSISETDPGISWIVTGNNQQVTVEGNRTTNATISNKFCSLISNKIEMSVNNRGHVIAKVYIEFTDGYNAFITDVEAVWTLPDGSKKYVRTQTNSKGMATFRLNNPPAGTYTIEVLDVDWPGEQFNKNKGHRIESIEKL
ncbi:MAG: hypothetical protein HC822_01490 [Oscillochloris sp.]|nr:hypothetical protein [Oscillochloris sp.]